MCWGDLIDPASFPQHPRAQPLEHMTKNRNTEVSQNSCMHFGARQSWTSISALLFSAVWFCTGLVCVKWE